MGGFGDSLWYDTKVAAITEQRKKDMRIVATTQQINMCMCASFLTISNGGQRENMYVNLKLMYIHFNSTYTSILSESYLKNLLIVWIFLPGLRFGVKS